MRETSLHALWIADCSQQLGQGIHEENERSRVRDGSGDYVHEEKNIWVVANGGVFIIEEAECELRWVDATLRKKHIVKMRAMLGPERTDDTVADILNRVVEWKDEELWTRGMWGTKTMDRG